MFIHNHEVPGIHWVFSQARGTQVTAADDDIVRIKFYQCMKIVGVADEN